MQLALTGVSAIESDEGFFAACAARALALDAWPLIECVDTKPPGIFLIYQGAFALFGAYATIGLRLAAIVIVLVMAWLTRAVARRLAPGTSGNVAAALLVLLLMTSNYFLALKTELFATALMLAALLAMLRWRDGGGWRDAALAGVAIGCATLFKQPAILMGGVCGAMMLDRLRTSPRCVIISGLALALGTLAPLAIVAGAYAATGAWEPFVQQLWLRPTLYATHKSAGFSLADVLAKAIYELRGPAAVAALFAVAAMARGWLPRPAILLLLPHGLMAIAITALGQHFFPSYFVILLPWLALMLSGGYAMAGQGRLPLIAGALVALGLAGATVSRLHDAERVSSQLATAITAQAQPGDRLYVWGYVPELYPATGRIPASRFVATSMLFGYFHDSNGYTPPLANMRYVFAGDWDRFLADLRASGSFVLVDTSAIRMGAPGNYPPQAFPAMRAFITAHCEPRGTAGAFPIWRCQAAENAPDLSSRT